MRHSADPRTWPRWRLLPIVLASIPLLADDRELTLNPAGLGLPTSEASALAAAIRTEAWANAEQILFLAAEADPADAKVLRALGVAHYQAGRHFPAASALKRSDAITTLEHSDRFLLASAYLRIERGHWARAELDRLVEEHPANSRYRYSLARIYYDQERFADAAQVARQAIRLDGTSVEAYDLLGQCLEGLGDFPQAATMYNTAISLDARNAIGSPWPHFHLGSLLHDLGDLARAEASLGAAIAIDAHHGPSFRELGIVRQKSGKLDAAAEALEAAGRLLPDDPRIQYLLSRVYLQLGDAVRSKVALERIRQLSGTQHQP